MDACPLENDSGSLPCPIHLSTHSPIYPSTHPPIHPPTPQQSFWWSTQETLSAAYFVLDPLRGLSPCLLGAPSLGEETNNTSPSPTHCINCVRKEEQDRRSPGKEPTAQPASWKASQGRSAVRKHPSSLVLPSAQTPEPLLCARPRGGKMEQVQPAPRSYEGAWVGVSTGSCAAGQNVQHQTARGSR